MQVIEKAYKKLRLDALVIQQGRLVENTKSVNKEDLLSMVRGFGTGREAGQLVGQAWHSLDQTRAGCTMRFAKLITE